MLQQNITLLPWQVDRNGNDEESILSMPTSLSHINKSILLVNVLCWFVRDQRMQWHQH